MTTTDLWTADYDLTASAVDRRHWIGGRRVGSAGGTEPIEVLSPIDGSPLGSVAGGGPSDIDAAVAAARQAAGGWAALGPSGRGKVLDRFAAGILDHRLSLATVETLDTGSVYAANLKSVVRRSALNISYFADYARRLRPQPVVGYAVDNRVHYEPAGVVGVVVPWNAPLLLATWKLGPALAAGNTVVLKPPEWAPLTCSLLADIAEEAGLPPGVLNVVQGTGPMAGRALAAHPGIDRLCFVGSTGAGREVGAAAAKALTPTSLELGGKSPFVVFADADLDAAASTVGMQFANAGQVCLAGTRILVQRSAADEFLERVLRATAEATVGDPRRAGVRVGPLIHPQQLRRVEGFVERSVGAGARVLAGGASHPLGGLYYLPTILDRVAPDAEVVQSEVFGPVLTWQTFADEAEAVELANATDFGLSGVVFTGDRQRADRVAAGIVAGTVWVNCYFVRDLGAPYGGARDSGIGREGGIWSFDFFCNVKNVAVRHGSFVTGLPEDELDDLGERSAAGADW